MELSHCLFGQDLTNQSSAYAMCMHIFKWIMIIKHNIIIFCNNVRQSIDWLNGFFRSYNMNSKLFTAFELVSTFFSESKFAWATIIHQNVYAWKMENGNHVVLCAKKAEHLMCCQMHKIEIKNDFEWWMVGWWIHMNCNVVIENSR